jgi:hypothetical protein
VKERVSTAPRLIRDILAGMATKKGDSESDEQVVHPVAPIIRSLGAEPKPENTYFDLDLAEFPVFSLSANGEVRTTPLEYRDEIQGANGKRIERSWKVFPGPHGFGGPTAQALLFDLIQLYVEQGCKGTIIKFGTMRSLLLRRGKRHPGKDDYERLRRDMTILRGLDFHCKNACWDARKKAYVDAEWRLFGGVWYFKSNPDDHEADMPYGFIEVSEMFQKMARSRGFYATNLASRLFHSLSPLEQRLALYLTKKFLFQPTHRRYFDDLAEVLPIEALCPGDARKSLKRAVERLQQRNLPFFGGFDLIKNQAGRWVASFTRGEIPKERYAFPTNIAEKIAPDLAYHVDRIVEAVGNDKDRVWWTECAKRLGVGSVDRALGQFKEAKQLYSVRNPGGLLTKIFKDIAAERNISITA